jgi:hypothetical protein
VGSCSIIFAVFFLIFLQSQFGGGFFNGIDPVGEFTGYTEFILITFVCFYSAAFVSLRSKKFLSTYFPPWTPTFILGSVFLASYSTIRLSGGIDEFWLVFFATIFVAGVSCGIASAYVKN